MCNFALKHVAFQPLNLSLTCLFISLVHYHFVIVKKKRFYSIQNRNDMYFILLLQNSYRYRNFEFLFRISRPGKVIKANSTLKIHMHYKNSKTWTFL